MTAWTLIAQTTTSGPVAVQSGTEPEIRAAYRKAMRELMDGGYSEDVKDFAVGHPVGMRERGAEEADRAMALIAQFEGTTTRTQTRMKGW